MFLNLPKNRPAILLDQKSNWTGLNVQKATVTESSLINCLDLK